MTRHSGQPDNAYTAKQLEIIGCCSESNARRRYFPEQGGCLKADDFVLIARHFEERNTYYKENPKRAGNKIWDKQRFDFDRLAGGLFKKM